MSLKQKVGSSLTTIKKEWSKPGPGNKVSYKEILSLGIGGMGQQFVLQIVGFLALGTSNMLIAYTVGIRPLHIQYMIMILQVLGIFFGIIRSKIVDNTNTKWGRFRPYIAIMGFPLVLIASIYIFLPFDTMAYKEKLLLTFIFTVAISMISPLFTDTYTQLVTVITPNSEERTKIISINAIIYSIAPTLTGLFVPILSEITGGYTNINTYRYIVVPIAVVGVSLNLFTAFGCKERTIVSKNYVPKVGIWEGAREIWKNKHWRIQQIANQFAFLEGAAMVLLTWIYVYGLQDMTKFGVVSTIIGTSSLIAMLITPTILRRIGNRKILLLHNALNVVFLTAFVFTFKAPIFLLIFWYLNSLVNALPLVYASSIHSEVKDYQQYLSGKRMDFMFDTASMLFIPIGLVTGLVIPAVYEMFGLTTNYDILYDPAVRNSLIVVLCVMSIVGAILNLIPFWFFGLSRTKHRNYIKVLHYRALVEDLADGNATPEQIVQNVDNIRETYKFINEPEPDISARKADLAAAKAMVHATKDEKEKRAKAIRDARKALLYAKALPEEKEAATDIFIKELTRFDDPAVIEQMERAKSIVTVDIEDLVNIDADGMLREARSFPKKTQEEKRVRKELIGQAKEMRKMVKRIPKSFKDKIVVPLQKDIDDIMARPDGTREEIQARNKALKVEENRHYVFRRAFAPYLEAKKLLEQNEICRGLVDELESRYDDAVLEIDEANMDESTPAQEATQ